jgi:crotonobetainyl-CoA:carnitine CoA-transferase CaiB-like acyl-CoA transferase
MEHDNKILKNEEKIEQLKREVPEWIRKLERPATPTLAPAFGPLQGIRAVSSGIVIAQPYVGTKLAQFGAEVIHVERPGGDIHRGTAPKLTRGKRPHGCDWANEAVCRLSLGLDLKNKKGREILMALWKISDVWMESSMPGTWERNGLSPELALAVNPKLVILRVSTYGQYGAEDVLSRPGYDFIAQAYGGMLAVTGDPYGPPQRAKVYTADYLTALHGWAAVMMGLWEAKSSGKGQVIDLAMYESIFSVQGFQMPWISGEGKMTGHVGNKAPGFQPYDTFECNDGYVVIGAMGDNIFKRIPKVLGLDPEVYSYENCSKDEAAVSSEKGMEFDRKLRVFCKSRTRTEVETILNEAKIGCSRVMNARDILEEEHYLLRDSHIPVQDRQSGMTVRVGNVTPKMSRTPGQSWRGAPAIGEDTDNILNKLLGRSDSDLQDYYAEGIIHSMEGIEADAAR